MKIMICSYDGENYFGGPFTWLQRILPIWIARGISVRVLLFAHQPPDNCSLVRFCRKHGIPFTVKNWHSLTYYRDNTEDRIRWILRQISNEVPDVFIPNLVTPAYYASRWIKAAGIPTIGILHSDDKYYHALADEFIYGRPENCLSAVVCVSKMLEDIIIKNNLNDVFVARIPYYIPIPEVPEKRDFWKVKIVYAGRLVEKQKQISKVIKSICQVLLQVPSTEAFIYGDGPSRNRIKEIINGYGKTIPIHLIGAISSEKLQHEYKDKHIFVMLSDYEGLPIALLEAMATGLVPVCLNIRSGIPELIKDKETGIVVKNRNEDFLHAIKLLVNDNELFKKLSQNAKKLIKDEYCSNVTVDSWIDLFNELRSKINNRDKAIYIPKRIDLSPVNSNLVGEDRRKLSTDQYVISQVIRTGNFLKRKIKKLVAIN